MNISVPEKSKVNLNKPEFLPEDEEKLNEFLEEKAKTHHTLVIHLGIIEKILKNTKNDSDKDKKIEDWLKEYDAKFKFVIVISGRGKPPSLPSDTRFLHYSLIARYIYEERSKYHLCKVLRAARRLMS
jgi:hypothetical protein